MASAPLSPGLPQTLTSISSTVSSEASTAAAEKNALFRLPLRVGCVGGGQLGRMMALEAPRLNIVMSFLDVDGPTCPAAQVVPSSHMYQGTLHDAAKIRQLVQEQQLDVLTVEIEHVGVETLLELEEQEGVNVQPSGRVLQIIRDKYLQKQHLVQHSIPTAPFVATSSVADIQQAAQQLGLPLMLKSRRGGYDGRGNAVLKLNTEQAILDALWTLDAGATDPLDLYAEGWIDHLCEISVLVVQSTNANMPSISYPPVTTIQQDSVCRVVLAPAPNLSEHLSLECQRVAQQAIQALASPASSSSDTSITPAAGIYGVELFVTRDHQVLVNEIAPRPHNTGHFTQDACHVNQFENHLRAISGLPLGSTDLKVEAAAMVNIMGAASNRLEDTVSGANMALTMPRASVHWYGKEQCRKGRKMGHINLTANSQGELFADLLPLLDMEGIPRESVLRPTTALLSTTMPYYLPTLSMSPPPLVAVIMGSQSDLPTMQGAVDILKQFDIPHQVDIVSAHRTPDKLVQYAKTAESRGLRVIIAGAGGAAHLPGMVASLTPLPVIGVPVMTSTLHGVDSLYSIVQMPKGIPVATVAIGNAPNAALLAVRILSTSRLDLRRKLQQYQHDLEHMVEESSMQLLRLGTDEFLQLPKL